MMEQVRIVVAAPQDGQCWVIVIPAGDLCVDLRDPQLFPQLAQEIDNKTPFVISAEASNVYYRFGQQSGIANPNAYSNLATGSGTGAAQQVSAIKFAGQEVTQAETIFPPNYFLAMKALATGVLRIRTVG